MNADYARSKSEAQGLLKVTFGKNINFPVNLAQILQKLELQAFYSTSIQDEACLNPKERVIYIKKDDLPMSRKLFSIAHEIGHWVLHSHDKIRQRLKYMGNANEIDKIEEQEANAFAAELLMPYDEVAKLIFLGLSVSDLVDYFNVSYQFAYYRYSYVYGTIY